MDRLTVFNQLASEAAECVRCERMCERRAVLSHLNGAIDARLMFIAEAPGRAPTARAFHFNEAILKSDRLAAQMHG